MTNRIEFPLPFPGDKNDVINSGLLGKQGNEYDSVKQVSQGYQFTFKPEQFLKFSSRFNFPQGKAKLFRFDLDKNPAEHEFAIFSTSFDKLVTGIERLANGKIKVEVFLKQNSRVQNFLFANAKSKVFEDLGQKIQDLFKKYKATESKNYRGWVKDLDDWQRQVLVEATQKFREGKKKTVVEKLIDNFNKPGEKDKAWFDQLGAKQIKLYLKTYKKLEKQGVSPDEMEAKIKSYLEEMWLEKSFSREVRTHISTALVEERGPVFREMLYKKVLGFLKAPKGGKKETGIRYWDADKVFDHRKKDNYFLTTDNYAAFYKTANLLHDRAKDMIGDPNDATSTKKADEDLKKFMKELKPPPATEDEPNYYIFPLLVKKEGDKGVEPHKAVTTINGFEIPDTHRLPTKEEFYKFLLENVNKADKLFRIPNVDDIVFKLGQQHIRGGISGGDVGAFVALRDPKVVQALKWPNFEPVQPFNYEIRVLLIQDSTIKGGDESEAGTPVVVAKQLSSSDLDNLESLNYPIPKGYHPPRTAKEIEAIKVFSQSKSPLDGETRDPNYFYVREMAYKYSHGGAKGYQEQYLKGAKLPLFAVPVIDKCTDEESEKKRYYEFDFKFSAGQETELFKLLSIGEWGKTSSADVCVYETPIEEVEGGKKKEFRLFKVQIKRGKVGHALKAAKAAKLIMIAYGGEAKLSAQEAWQKVKLEAGDKEPTVDEKAFKAAYELIGDLEEKERKALFEALDDLYDDTEGGFKLGEWLEEAFNKPYVLFPLMLLLFSFGGYGAYRLGLRHRRKKGAGQEADAGIKQEKQREEAKLSQDKKEFLDKYTRDFVRMWLEGDLEPAVGREKDVAQFFKRKMAPGKSGGVATGDAGVGKSDFQKAKAMHMAIRVFLSQKAESASLLVSDFFATEEKKTDGRVVKRGRTINWLGLRWTTFDHPRNTHFLPEVIEKKLTEVIIAKLSRLSGGIAADSPQTFDDITLEEVQKLQPGEIKGALVEAVEQLTSAERDKLTQEQQKKWTVDALAGDTTEWTAEDLKKTVGEIQLEAYCLCPEALVEIQEPQAEEEGEGRKSERFRRAKAVGRAVAKVPGAVAKVPGAIAKKVRRKKAGDQKDEKSIHLVEKGTVIKRVDGTPFEFTSSALVPQFRELNVQAFVAGTSYRGDLEARVKLAILILSDDPFRLVLNIPEIADNMRAGESSGGKGFMTSFKGAMAEGSISVEGDAVKEDYDEEFGDTQMRRRLPPEELEQLSPRYVKVVVAMVAAGHISHLRKLDRSFDAANFYVDISDAAAEAIGRYAAQYFDQGEPDKSIDLTKRIIQEIYYNEWQVDQSHQPHIIDNPYEDKNGEPIGGKLMVIDAAYVKEYAETQLKYKSASEARKRIEERARRLRKKHRVREEELNFKENALIWKRGKEEQDEHLRRLNRMEKALADLEKDLEDTDKSELEIEKSKQRVRQAFAFDGRDPEKHKSEYDIRSARAKKAGLEFRRQLILEPQRGTPYGRRMAQIRVEDQGFSQELRIETNAADVEVVASEGGKPTAVYLAEVNEENRDLEAVVTALEGSPAIPADPVKGTEAQEARAGVKQSIEEDKILELELKRATRGGGEKKRQVSAEKRAKVQEGVSQMDLSKPGQLRVGNKKYERAKGQSYAAWAESLSEMATEKRETLRLFNETRKKIGEILKLRLEVERLEKPAAGSTGVRSRLRVQAHEASEGRLAAQKMDLRKIPKRAGVESFGDGWSVDGWTDYVNEEHGDLEKTKELLEKVRETVQKNIILQRRLERMNREGLEAPEDLTAKERAEVARKVERFVLTDTNVSDPELKEWARGSNETREQHARRVNERETELKQKVERAERVLQAEVRAEAEKVETRAREGGEEKSPAQAKRAAREKIHDEVREAVLKEAERLMHPEDGEMKDTVGADNYWAEKGKRGDTGTMTLEDVPQEVSAKAQENVFKARQSAAQKEEARADDVSTRVADKRKAKQKAKRTTPEEKAADEAVVKQLQEHKKPGTLKGEFLTFYSRMRGQNIVFTRLLLDIAQRPEEEMEEFLRTRAAAALEDMNEAELNKRLTAIDAKMEVSRSEGRVKRMVYYTHFITLHAKKMEALYPAEMEELNRAAELIESLVRGESLGETLGETLARYHAADVLDASKLKELKTAEKVLDYLRGEVAEFQLIDAGTDLLELETDEQSKALGREISARKQRLAAEASRWHPNMDPVLEAHFLIEVISRWERLDGTVDTILRDLQSSEMLKKDLELEAQQVRSNTRTTAELGEAAKRNMQEAAALAGNDFSFRRAREEALDKLLGAEGRGNLDADQKQLFEALIQRFTTEKLEQARLIVILNKSLQGETLEASEKAIIGDFALRIENELAAIEDKPENAEQRQRLEKLVEGLKKLVSPEGDPPPEPPKGGRRPEEKGKPDPKPPAKPGEAGKPAGAGEASPGDGETKAKATSPLPADTPESAKAPVAYESWTPKLAPNVLQESRSRQPDLKYEIISPLNAHPKGKIIVIMVPKGKHTRGTINSWRKKGKYVVVYDYPERLEGKDKSRMQKAVRVSVGNDLAINPKRVKVYRRFLTKKEKAAKKEAEARAAAEAAVKKYEEKFVVRTREVLFEDGNSRRATFEIVIPNEHAKSFSKAKRVKIYLVEGLYYDENKAEVEAEFARRYNPNEPAVLVKVRTYEALEGVEGWQEVELDRTPVKDDMPVEVKTVLQEVKRTLADQGLEVVDLKKDVQVFGEEKEKKKEKEKVEQKTPQPPRLRLVKTEKSDKPLPRTWEELLRDLKIDPKSEEWAKKPARKQLKRVLVGISADKKYASLVPEIRQAFGDLTKRLTSGSNKDIRIYTEEMQLEIVRRLIERPAGEGEKKVDAIQIARDVRRARRAQVSEIKHKTQERRAEVRRVEEEIRKVDREEKKRKRRRRRVAP